MLEIVDRPIARQPSFPLVDRQHVLALDAVQQDVPQVITDSFASIASLMNGSSPIPMPGDSEEDPDDEEEDQLVLGLRSGTVLRHEAFGGIVFNASLPFLQYLNRPAVTLFERIDQGEITRSKLGSLFQSLRPILERGRGSPLTGVFYDRQNFGALNYPISATIELTYSCHHACRHCMNTSGPKFTRENERSPKYWIDLITEMKSRGLFHIYFSGGETIRYGRYNEIFEACDAIGVRYLLVSDLAAHTEDDFRILTRARNLDTVRVSLDGHDAQVHDYMRGRGAFDKTVRGIRRLQQDGIDVGIYHSVHRKNLPQVERFLDFCRSLGIETVMTGVACAIGRGKSRIEALNDQECGALSEIYLRYVREGKIRPIHGAWHRVARNGQRSVFQTWRDFAHSGTHRIHLTPDGSIRMCPKLEGTRFSRFGSASPGAIEKAWNSIPLNDLRINTRTVDGITGVPVDALE